MPLDSNEHRRQGIVIINPYGGIWGPNVFESPAQARQHLENFWRGIPCDLTKFKLAWGEQVTRIALTPGEPQFIDLPPADPATSQ